MRNLLVYASLLFATSSAHADQKEMDKFVSHLLSEMTIEEKAGQMNQVSADMQATGPVVSIAYRDDIASGRVGSVLNAMTPQFTRELQKLAVEKSRLKIPLLFGIDAVHGYKTIFPIPLAESASWDMPLIEKAARITATEVSADGIHWTFAPMLDVSRDPRWGRVSEGEGEDPWLASRIAEADVKGLQTDHLGAIDSVIACVKHFVAYGTPFGGRDYNSGHVSERDIVENYFPPFHAAVVAGAASLMPAFNDLDGIPSTSNVWLLKKTLRDEWGFKGVIVTDWGSIHEMLSHGVASNDAEASLLALKATVDIDMEGHAFGKEIPGLVKSRRVTLKRIDESVRRILELKYKLGLFTDPYRFSNDERAKNSLLTDANRATARDLARKSIVLLQNGKNILPLKRDAKLAVIGPFAKDRRNILGSWALQGDWSKATTLVDGLTNAMKGQGRISYALGANIVEDGAMFKLLNNKQNSGDLVIDSRPKKELLDEAVSIAKNADIIILALGESQNMTGESASRVSIRLPDNQQELLAAVRAATKSPIVLLLSNGRPLVLTNETKAADAIVENWFLGTESGNAIADVLFGDYNPSGHLTMTFPRAEGQIPIFYAERPTGRPYEPDMWYVTKYLDASNSPLFPFGYGLSYTTFKTSQAKLSAKSIKLGEGLQAIVNVRNTGSVAGEETVQLYLHQKVASVGRPVKLLKAMKKVFLKPGESTDATFNLKDDDFKLLNREVKWVTEPGEIEVLVGDNSADLQASTFSISKR